MMDNDNRPKTFFDWIGLAAAPDWTKARPLGAFVGILILAFLLLAIAAGVFVLTSVFREPAAAGATGNLGVGALIVAILGAPFVIWNTWIRQRALNFQKEGHITDRINKAVEHLGAEKTVKRAVTRPDGTTRKDKDRKPLVVEETVPNIEVRIGGLLSLERIAQDSTIYDKGRDHVRVMEILCTYIRENAPARSARNHDLGEWEPLKDGASDDEKATPRQRFGESGFGGKLREWVNSLPPPREDIALALRILGRRNAKQRQAEARWGSGAATDGIWVFDTPCPALPDKPGEAALTKAELAAYKSRLHKWKEDLSNYAGYRLDLRNTNLQRADLSSLDLSGALVSKARMEGAYFRGARMVGADLSQAGMEGADLHQAGIMGADLHEARMGGRTSARRGCRGRTSTMHGLKGRSSAGRGWRGRSSGIHGWKGRNSPTR